VGGSVYIQIRDVNLQVGARIRLAEIGDVLPDLSQVQALFVRRQDFFNRLRVDVEEGDALEDSDGDSDGEGDALGLPDGLSDADGDKEADGERLAEGLKLGDSLILTPSAGSIHIMPAYVGAGSPSEK